MPERILTLKWKIQRQQLLLSISPATLQYFSAQAESNASMLELQAKYNADLLERLLE